MFSEEVSILNKITKSNTKLLRTMSSIVKALDPIIKIAARTYQGALATELNKMGKDEQTIIYIKRTT